VADDAIASKGTPQDAV